MGDDPDCVEDDDVVVDVAEGGGGVLADGDSTPSIGTGDPAWLPVDDVCVLCGVEGAVAEAALPAAAGAALVADAALLGIWTCMGMPMGILCSVAMMSGWALSTLGGALEKLTSRSDMACWAWLRRCIVCETLLNTACCSRKAASPSRAGSERTRSRMAFQWG